MFTNNDQRDHTFSRYRFFLPSEDYDKIKDIINTEDNFSHQCRSHVRACLDTEESFTKLVSVMYFVEEHYDDNNSELAVHEGIL